MMALNRFKHFVNRKWNAFVVHEKMRLLLDNYEEYIGVKEVRNIQRNVLRSEAEFVESSKQRRLTQSQLMTLQDQLKQLRQKLDTVKRSDETYLELVTSEHKLMRNELKLINELKLLEETERENFGSFSQKLREAHEVERLRQEKSKYISLIGSIVGALLGIIATSINHAMKMNDFKQLVEAIETKNSATKLTDHLKIKHSLGVDRETQVEALDVKEAKSLLEENLKLSNQKIEEILSNTENNLEYRLKINAIVTVVTTYALLAVTLPLIMKFFD